jgi:biotin transport system permease protein
MIALYRPGTSPLHRMPAGPKVLIFAAVALLLSLLPVTVWTVVTAYAVVGVAYVLSRVGIREFGHQLYTIRWMVVVMLIPQLILLTPLAAVTTTSRVVAVILLAALVTLTTRVPDLLDAIERSLGPLRRFGVDGAAIGLLFALTITAIPVIRGFAFTIREAQCARGARTRLSTFTVPLLVLSLKHADDVADALAARGVR